MLSGQRCLAKLNCTVSGARIIQCRDSLAKLNCTVSGGSNNTVQRTHAEQQLKRGYPHDYVIDLDIWAGLKRKQLTRMEVADTWFNFKFCVVQSNFTTYWVNKKRLFTFMNLIELLILQQFMHTSLTSERCLNNIVQRQVCAYLLSMWARARMIVYRDKFSYTVLPECDNCIQNHVLTTQIALWSTI